jgi:hypothetical protein
MFSSAIGFIFVALAYGPHINGLDRRVLRYDESIADYTFSYSFVDGQDPLHFTIKAELNGPDDKPFTSSANNSPTEIISIDVITAIPAITAETYVQLANGTSVQLDDKFTSLNALLVSDTTTAAGRSGITIIAIDPITHETRGITEQKGRNSIKIHQAGDGGIVKAVEEEIMEAPRWECGVGKEINLLAEHHQSHHRKHESRDHVSSMLNKYMMCFFFHFWLTFISI